MKQYTLKTEIKLYFIFLLIAIFSFVSGDAQNVRTTAAGNYTAITTDTASAGKLTGKTFTDAKGETSPVYISPRGKLYVIRTSKTGKTYKFYLKP